MRTPGKEMESDVSRNIDEQLSAFLDGELPEEELQLLVRRLERDEDHRATLIRYSVIGNVLRADPEEASSVDFRARIMAAIDEENDPVELAAINTGRTRSWLRPVASVVALAVIGIGLVSNGVFETDIGNLSSQVAGTDKPLVAPVADGRRTVPPRVASEINRERLTSYMVSHGEYARSFHGPMGNSRIFVQQASFEQ